MEKIGTWYRRLAFRRRVLLSFFFVSLIPVIVLGTFGYVQTRNLLIKREKEMLQETLEQNVLMLNSAFETYVHVMENLIWDVNIKQALTERYQNNLQMYRTYRDVIDPAVMRMKSLNPQIKQLTIYSANPTLYRHGDVVQPITAMEEMEEVLSDYRVHWIDENGTLKLCCRFYLDGNPEENVVVIRLDYASAFGGLSALFREDYGILITEENGASVYSCETFASGVDGRELVAGKMPEGIVLEENVIPSNGWRIYLYRPVSAVSSAAGSITLLILAVVALCLAAVFFASVMLTRSVVRPLGELNENIDRIEDGNLSVEVKGETDDEIGHIIHSFSRMVERLNHMVNENYKSKIAQQQYEMRALQAQINPHFLYNSLSLINWKAIMAGEEEISEMAQLLSTFYRTMLNKGKNIIGVEGEWNNTCSYVHIQRMMHSGKFEARMKLEEGMKAYQMLNLLLQPLVENAIVHGLDYKTDGGEKCLEVRGFIEVGCLVFIVEDNGCGMDEETLDTILTAKTGGYGVQNVHHRIQLYYGEQYGLHYESWKGKGTRVTLRIPFAGQEAE